MPRLPWIDFLQQHHKAHLVSAVIVPHRASQHVRRLRGLMDRLIKQRMGKQGNGSAFATAIVRKGGSAEIHCGFADKADADQLAELTGASAADPDSHWSSHRSFDVTAEKEVALTGLLAPNGDR
jgi:hypothetical protein